MIYLVEYPKKTEDANFGGFNMITKINVSRTLTKHISCKCKCKFDGKNVTKIKNGITVNVNVCVCVCVCVSVCVCVCVKNISGILAHVLVIKSDETIEVTKTTLTKTFVAKTIPTNFNKKSN